MLHCIALHYMAFGVMSRTYSCDRTGTSSFIGHNDAASYLVGYEGRSSYAFICISIWLRAGCYKIHRDILWKIMSHIVLWLIKLWIYNMWPVWIFGFWFDVIALKLTWEAILFPVRWVMVCLKGLWIYYMHFIAFVGPLITLNIILFYYGYDIYSCYFIFPSCYGFCRWLLFH